MNELHSKKKSPVKTGLFPTNDFSKRRYVTESYYESLINKEWKHRTSNEKQREIQF